MKNNLLYSVIVIALLSFPNISFSQTPNGTLNLGILTSFEAYTGAGAVTNSGGTVTGDIGTHLGIISGFPKPPNIGDHYTADAVTDQARFDLLRLYIHLNALSVDFPNAFDSSVLAHAPAFGSGETISPGVYSIGGAGSIAGALTLNGGGNPDAVFVIKMNGAFTVGAGAKVSLTNGTKSSNVFWLINGAISVAADADVKGTLFSKAGAVGLGANVILEGRMLSMAGAITMGVGSSATPPPDPSTIPVFCEADCTPAPAVNILGVLSDFALFTSAGAVANTGITGINGTIGTQAGTITGYTGGIHIGTEEIANALTLQAAADLDAAYSALMAMTPTVTHAAAFLDETLAPGVYHIEGAGSLGGTVILDAAGNSDAIFVFRFAGAFNVAAASKTILANGAKRCNVFWLGGARVATGAVNVGASSEVQGTFMSHRGASNSGAGAFIAGRQLSTLGAVNTNTAVIYNNPQCVTSRSLNSPFDHIQIKHDGEGSNCAAENVTVEACADTACSTLATSGGIAATLQPFGAAVSIDASGSATVTVNPSSIGDNTLNATSISPAPTNTTQVTCLNTATNVTSCSLLVSTCSFNCLESGLAPGSARLYTKLAGTPFSFDVIALNPLGAVEANYVASGGTAKNVTLELVDGTDSTACASRSVLAPAVSQSLTFIDTDAGRKPASLTVNNAYPNLRCRVTDANVAPTIYGCSSDDFSVRPINVTLTSSDANANSIAPLATSPQLIKAGADFNLSAATVSTDNYSGLLTLDASKLLAQTPTQDSTTQSGGTVGILTPFSLSANSAAVNATYSEVGYVYLTAGAYRDELFTAVDSAVGDCITNTTNNNNLSDTLISSMYGCHIGNITTASLGRFVPDHFTVVATIANACTVGNFTYIGQPLTLSQANVVEARNAADDLTQNYAGVYAPGTVSFGAENADNGTDLFSRLTFSNNGSWALGIYTLTSANGTFSRPTTTTPDATWGSFESLDIGLTVNDSDVTTSPKVSGADMNPSTAGGSGFAYKKFSGSPLRMRLGRLKLQNAYGSELRDLPMSLTAQYWNGSAWTLNDSDTCTTGVNLSLADVSPTDGLEIAEVCVWDTGILLGNSSLGCATAGAVAKIFSAPPAAGNFKLNFMATGAGNSGSVDVTATVPTWLRFDWQGTGEERDPTARATFGIYKGNSRFIDIRELY